MRMKKQVSEPARAFRRPPPAQQRIGARPSLVRKQSTNVSIDAEILAEAKAMGINLSQTLEAELRALVQEERNSKFQEEHREAIESYNQFIAKNGIWSEKYRKW